MNYNFNLDFQSSDAIELRRQVTMDILFNEEPPDYEDIKININVCYKDVWYSDWKSWVEKVVKKLYVTRISMDMNEYGVQRSTLCRNVNDNPLIVQPDRDDTIIPFIYKMIVMQKKQLENQRNEIIKLKEIIDNKPKHIPVGDLIMLDEEDDNRKNTIVYDLD